MSDQDIFNANPEQDNAPKSSSQGNPEDLLKMILNENGEPKYKSLNSALEALTHSQQFIPTLQSENAKLKEQLQAAQAELEKVGSVESVVTKLFENRSDPNPTADPQKAGGLDESKVAEMFNQLLSKQRSEEQQAANLNTVVSKLSELYGDKAGEMIKQKASELGATTEQLKQLSMTNPNMVLAYFDGVKTISKNPSSGTVIPPHQPPKAPGLQPPEKSLLRGANSKEVAAYWAQVKQDTYNKLGVET